MLGYLRDDAFSSHFDERQAITQIGKCFCKFWDPWSSIIYDTLWVFKKLFNNLYVAIIRNNFYGNVFRSSVDGLSLKKVETLKVRYKCRMVEQ